MLRDDLDGQSLQLVLLDKVLGGQNGTAGAIRGGAALEQGQVLEHLATILNLVKGVFLLELAVWVELACKSRKTNKQSRTKDVRSQHNGRIGW